MSKSSPPIISKYTTTIILVYILILQFKAQVLLEAVY